MINIKDLIPGTYIIISDSYKPKMWEEDRLLDSYYIVTKTAFSNMTDVGEHNKIYFRRNKDLDALTEYNVDIGFISKIISQEEYPEYFI